ncbi:MAG: hypothetical protein ACK4UJ_04965 [Leptonema sp. (in: bacteria)]
MNCYKVKKEQKEESFILRIMIFQPYLLYLKQLQNSFNSNTEMFFDLISKFQAKIDKLTSQKTSSKKKYQEIANNYANIGIRVSQAVHQILKDFSDVTGYSISALVRFLIEWYFFEDSSEENQLLFDIAANSTGSFETVITEVEIYHRFSIKDETVEETFRWGFS